MIWYSLFEYGGLHLGGQSVACDRAAIAVHYFGLLSIFFVIVTAAIAWVGFRSSSKGTILSLGWRMLAAPGVMVLLMTVSLIGAFIFRTDLLAFPWLIASHGIGLVFGCPLTI